LANAPGEITALLCEMKLGSQNALARLIPLVYRELRRLAGHYMRDERASHTLQPTPSFTKHFYGWSARNGLIGRTGRSLSGSRHNSCPGFRWTTHAGAQPLSAALLSHWTMPDSITE
jgi:hypothetical protein